MACRVSIYVAGSLPWLCAGGAKLVQKSYQKLSGTQCKEIVKPTYVFEKI